MGKNREVHASTLKSPLAKRSVVNLVLDRIKEALMSKELGPGDYLPSETELVNNLGVGKTSVREAVKMLEAVGIVDVRQGHGTRIREKAGEDSLSPLLFQLILEQGTNQQLIELRMMFEPAFTALAMEKASEEDLEWIQESIKDFEAKIKLDAQTAADDLEFHRRILAVTDNPFIIKIGSTVLELFRASVSTSMKTIPKTALRDHKAIYKAFKAKDADALNKAILRSYEGWEKAL